MHVKIGKKIVREYLSTKQVQMNFSISTPIWSWTLAGWKAVQHLLQWACFEIQAMPSTNSADKDLKKWILESHGFPPSLGLGKGEFSNSMLFWKGTFALWKGVSFILMGIQVSGILWTNSSDKERMLKICGFPPSLGCGIDDYLSPFAIWCLSGAGHFLAEREFSIHFNRPAFKSKLCLGLTPQRRCWKHEVFCLPRAMAKMNIWLL